MLNLKRPTSPAWVQAVFANFDAFLIDHAACERKASATGMSFVVKYPDRRLLLDPMIEFAREMLESGRARGYLYDGPIPLILAVADETAMIAPTDEKGIPTAVIVTENEAIRSWVESQLDEYRSQSIEVTADDIVRMDGSSLGKNARLRAWAQAYRHSRGCRECGEDDSACLQFHHVRGEKTETVGSMLLRGASAQRVFDEIEKCDVLCANCHRQVHYQPPGVDVPSAGDSRG